VDLQLYLRVLWRFRLLVMAGLLLAFVLAFLATVRVSSEGLTYRDEQLWSSTSRLFVTQKGFPWGRTVTAETTATPDRFVNLAVLYAQFAESDEVRAIMRRDGSIKGEVVASVVVAPGDIHLPLIDVTGLATDPQTAEVTTARAVDAILEYIGQQQDASRVPPAERILVQVVAAPEEPLLVDGRPLTRPIVVFVVTLFGTIGLAFILQNLRPPKRPPNEEDENAEPEALLVAGERRVFTRSR
jgi:hypothetical protein